VPPDSVRCTRKLEAELATFGKMGGRSAIIHRTVPGVPAEQRLLRANGRLQTHSMRYSARQSQSSARRRTRRLQDLSGAPPDSPEAPPVRAPTVRTQRPSDVAGAPDCPVRHATAAFQRPLLVVGAINTPTTPHSIASKFSTFYTLQEL
jgi:hypothetical protein